MGLGLHMVQTCSMRQTLRFSHRQSLEQSHKLSHEQKLLLKQVLGLRLELKEPTFPHALRGLSGMQAAHELLKKRGGVGLLIGGLAEAIWNQECTEANLAAHKDVDVLVPEALEIGQFESGIDWWTMEEFHFESIRSEASVMENVRRKFWVNGNSVALLYRIAQLSPLPPGLYFPSPDFAVAIRLAESFASIDNSKVVVEIDPAKFKRELRKSLGIKDRLPSFLTSEFPSSMPYTNNDGRRTFVFTEESISFSDQVALNSRGGYMIGK